MAALALFTLLYSVIGQAATAMSEAYVTLPVTLSEEEIDPDGTRDPKRTGLWHPLLLQQENALCQHGNNG